MSKPIDTSQMTLVGVQAALTAGYMLKRVFGTTFSVNAKPGKQNLVTEHDKASEKIIVDTILNRFPDHTILAEEGGLKSGKQSKVTWVIDPLDGTVNFARSVPLFAVSIGICINDVVQAGIIYQPMTDELFIAEKGKGSFYNKSKIGVTKIKKVDDAIIATGLPYQIDGAHTKSLKDFENIASKGCPIRYLGSAALNLAYVAAGRFDAYWAISLEPWDIAAGKIIVEEAGGKVTDYLNKELLPYQPSTLLATNNHLHKEMLDYLCVKK